MELLRLVFIVSLRDWQLRGRFGWPFPYSGGRIDSGRWRIRDDNRAERFHRLLLVLHLIFIIVVQSLWALVRIWLHRYRYLRPRLRIWHRWRQLGRRYHRFNLTLTTHIAKRADASEEENLLRVYHGLRYRESKGDCHEDLPVIPILFGHADTSRVIATDSRMLVAVSQLLVA